MGRSCIQTARYIQCSHCSCCESRIVEHGRRCKCWYIQSMGSVRRCIRSKQLENKLQSTKSGRLEQRRWSKSSYFVEQWLRRWRWPRQQRKRTVLQNKVINIFYFYYYRLLTNLNIFDCFVQYCLRYCDDKLSWPGLLYSNLIFVKDVTYS